MRTPPSHPGLPIVGNTLDMIDDQLVTMIFAGHDTTAFARLETTLALATIGQRYALEPEMTMAARDGAPARVFTR